MDCCRKNILGLIFLIPLILGGLACEEGDDGDVSVPADEVWLDITVECPGCDASGDLLFYASPGATEGMPSFIVRHKNPSFPVEKVVKSAYEVQDETKVKAIPEGLYSFNAYQDLNAAGMAPDAGEPAAVEPQVIELKKGQLNAVTLELE